MADSETDPCAKCGHERLYHQGSGLFNTTGCGVTWCKCKSFGEKAGG